MHTGVLMMVLPLCDESLSLSWFAESFSALLESKNLYITISWVSQELEELKVLERTHKSFS